MPPFLSLLGLASVAAVLPALPASAARDEWQEFLERVKVKVDAILLREGRGLSSDKRRPALWIDPPRPVGDVYVRKVHVILEP